MQVLFLFAGMSIRYALNTRTYGQFAVERVKRLLVPLVFGVLMLSYSDSNTGATFSGRCKINSSLPVL